MRLWFLSIMLAVVAQQGGSCTSAPDEVSTCTPTSVVQIQGKDYPVYECKEFENE